MFVAGGTQEIITAIGGIITQQRANICRGDGKKMLVGAIVFSDDRKIPENFSPVSKKTGHSAIECCYHVADLVLLARRICPIIQQ